MTHKPSASASASYSLKLLVTTLLLALLAASAAIAAEGPRIGTVDIEKVLGLLDSRRDALETLEKRSRESEQTLDKLRQEIERTSRELEFFREDSSEYAARRDKIAALQQQFAQTADRLRANLEEAAEENLRTTLAQIYEAVRKFAAAEGYDFVVDARAVIYAAGGRDISLDIAQKMNKQYKEMQNELPEDTKESD